MSNARQLSERVAVGGQPTVDDLRRLREQGFAAVVNLRPDGEADQPLPPDAEGFAARESGLDYSHVPVAVADLDPEQVRKVRAAIDAANGPVYVHCAAGQRAIALSLLATAAGPGVHGDDLIARAAATGLPINDPKLAEFVRTQAERDRWGLLQAV
jgi:uncharacterized protein (TIGR01244 family)